MPLVYLTLAIIGTIVPYFFFIQHFAASGLGLVDFIQALFVNGAAGGISADVFISSLVFWIYLGYRKTPHLWAYVMLNLLVGLSCALPLYLFVQARQQSPTSAGEAMA